MKYWVKNVEKYISRFLNNKNDEWFINCWLSPIKIQKLDHTKYVKNRCKFQFSWIIKINRTSHVYSIK